MMTGLIYDISTVEVTYSISFPAQTSVIQQQFVSMEMLDLKRGVQRSQMGLGEDSEKVY